MERLLQLRNLFVKMTPIHQLQLESFVQDDTLQLAVLQHTVLCPVARKYPPSLSYRKSFLKKYISMLENSNIEVHEKIYKLYTDMLSMSDQELSYKTYCISSDIEVTLEESISIISGGTTGLVTWTAAQYMTDWVLENTHLFKEKNVIELGSGLGLLGCVICKMCRPKSYTFTDCHNKVLSQLKKNIKINFCSCSCDFGPSGDFLPKERQEANQKNNQTNIEHRCWIEHMRKCEEQMHVSVLKDRTAIRVSSLDWEKITPKELEDIKVDIILATDVVYDTEVILSLVNLLVILLNQNSASKHCEAYIASTIRNQDTTDAFHRELEKRNISYKPIQGPKNSNLMQDGTSVNFIKLETSKEQNQI